MSIDQNGSVYILDGDNGRITKWINGSSNGIIVAGGNGFGNNLTQIGGAYGMFVDHSISTIWIADSYNDRIIKWIMPSITGIYILGNFGSGSDQFFYPQGLFVDKINNSTRIFVTDTGNHRIQMFFEGDQSAITVAGITNYYGNDINQLWWPQTLVVDSNNNMYIVDFYNSRIIKWKIGYNFGIVIAGDSTVKSWMNPLPNLLSYPYGVNFDLNGNLYVADRLNNRIQKFSIDCCK